LRGSWQCIRISPSGTCADYGPSHGSNANLCESTDFSNVAQQQSSPSRDTHARRTAATHGRRATPWASALLLSDELTTAGISSQDVKQALASAFVRRSACKHFCVPGASCVVLRGLCPSRAVVPASGRRRHARAQRGEMREMRGGVWCPFHGRTLGARVNRNHGARAAT
jgi:hypothetical protein